MEVVINGKHIDRIRTLHLTECSCYDVNNKQQYIQTANYIIYDELNEAGETETHTLYFRSIELESIML